MKHLFVSEEIASLLKTKGFDYPCLAFYKNGVFGAVDQHWGSSVCGISENYGDKVDDLVPCPMYQQVVDWLRDKYGCILQVTFEQDTDKNECWFIADIFSEYVEETDCSDSVKRDYYEAFDDGIKVSLSLI